MIVEELELKGILLIKPQLFKDDRGYFFESYQEKRFNEAVGSAINFVQDNESCSSKNVLRGLHFQAPPFAQGKLVRVLSGAVNDVVVDIRKNSPTYGKFLQVNLSQENKQMLWIPPGFAHGFLALEDNTIFSYKCSNFYNKESEGGLNWNDPVLNIDWGLKSEPILSEKDKVEVNFTTFDSPF